MSVRVNLLPEEVKERGRAGRARVVAGVLGLVLVAALAGLWFMERAELTDTQDRLAEVEARNEALQVDIAALQPFADLDARANASVDVVALALAGEKSFATVLQDLSAVMPPSAELSVVTLTFFEESTAPSPGGTRLIHGRLSATGQVLAGHAPGVERLVIDLERVAAFDNVYVTTSSEDDEGVATFSLEVELGPEVLTNRYAIEGLAS